jgi:hypothetical protein
MQGEIMSKALALSFGLSLGMTVGAVLWSAALALLQ